MKKFFFSIFALFAIFVGVFATDASPPIQNVQPSITKSTLHISPAAPEAIQQTAVLNSGFEMQFRPGYSTEISLNFTVKIEAQGQTKINSYTALIRKPPADPYLIRLPNYRIRADSV